MASRSGSSSASCCASSSSLSSVGSLLTNVLLCRRSALRLDDVLAARDRDVRGGRGALTDIAGDHCVDVPCEVDSACGPPDPLPDHLVHLHRPFVPTAPAKKRFKPSR